jgi:hypothetical protein
MWILGAIPAVTCFVYYHRRLGARRELLRDTLTSMGLDTYYMKMRHAECKDFTPELFQKCFDEDFRSGLSVGDYLWPVALFTIVSLMGWLVTLGRAAESSGLNALLPPAIAYGFIGAFMASSL